jgi:hypothetical protein
MRLVVVDGYPDTAIFRQQFPEQFQPWIHQAQPQGMLQVVVVMAERRPGVVRQWDGLPPPIGIDVPD